MHRENRFEREKDMKKISLALIGAFTITGAASAVFTGVTVDITPNINGSGLTQYRFNANFDGPTDTVSSWGGLDIPGSHLIISTNDTLGFNQTGSPMGDPVWGWDFANAATYADPTAATDTWIGLADFAFATPGLLPALGGHVGATPSVDIVDEGVAYLPFYTVGIGSATIANLVVRDGYGVELGGSVSWSMVPGGPANDSAFYISNIPAPGALALLGLAGLTSRRRRNR
jgi:hypothetical protein